MNGVEVSRPESFSSCCQASQMSLHLFARGCKVMAEMEKSAVRRMVREKLRVMSQETLALNSTAACKRLLESSSFQGSKSVGIYVFCEKLREVDTWPVLHHCFQRETKKFCFVPKIDESQGTADLLEISSADDLEKGAKGILEPPLSYPSGELRRNALCVEFPLDIVVVPGLAFDRKGNRLGRGGGYYDRLLQGLLQRCAEKQWEPPMLVALAFDEQIIESIPLDSHDMPVDVVVTPSEWITYQ